MMIAQVRQLSSANMAEGDYQSNMLGNLYKRIKDEYGLNFIIKSCADKKSCMFSGSPLLRDIRKEAGETIILIWLDCLNDLLKTKQGLTSTQISVLTSVIFQEFAFLRLGELMLFIYDLITIMRKKFYDILRPTDFTDALYEWVEEKRSKYISEHEEQEVAKRNHSILSASGVTWEEACRIKGIEIRESPLAQLVSLPKFKTTRSKEDEAKATLELASAIANNTLGFDQSALENAEKVFFHSHNITAKQYLEQNK